MQNGTKEQSGYIIMRSPEKITARREKIFSAGDLLAEAGTPVDSYLLAAVTAAGVRNLTVYWNDRMEKLVDCVTWIICGLLMVLTVAARIRL